MDTITKETLQNFTDDDIKKLNSLITNPIHLPTGKLDCAVIWGRFQTWTKAHSYLLSIARQFSNQQLIVIGSANKKGDWRNPFGVEVRMNMIKEATRDLNNVKIIAADDLSPDELNPSPNWGEYVLDTLYKELRGYPSLMVYGEEQSRDLWFKDIDTHNMLQLIVPKNSNFTLQEGHLVNLSATLIRRAMILDDLETWKQGIPESIHFMYDSLRKELLEVPEYKNIYNNLITLPKSDWEKAYDTYAMNMKQAPK